MIGGSCAGVEGGVSSRKVEDTEEGELSKWLCGNCWIGEVTGLLVEEGGSAGDKGLFECGEGTMEVLETGEEGEVGC